MISELSKVDVNEVRPQSIEPFRNIKPETSLSAKDLHTAVMSEFEKAAATCEKSEVSENSSSEKNLALEHKDCLTTSEERKEFANRSKGTWSDEPGDSIFTPENVEAKTALKEYGKIGIEYTDGEPDFSKVSEATVQIKDMTSKRGDNFKKADTECANKWNEQNREGQTDWQARDVKKWRQDNRYSWHERLDMKTMDLVQRDIHDECKYFGGVAECKRHESLNGGGFDA